MVWRLLLPVVAVAVFASAAQAQTDWRKAWADVQARAAGQTLALAVHSVAANVAVAEAFQKRFPKIRVQVSQISESRFAPRLVKEQSAGIFAWDAWIGPTPNMNALVLPAGGLAALDPYLILPEVKDPQNWRSPRHLYASPGGHFSFSFSLPAGAPIFVNRTALGKIAIKTPEDLLQPALKGRIAARDPSVPNGGTLSLGGLIKPMGARGADFLRRLFTETGLVIMDNPRQITSAVMRGDKSVVIGGQVDVVTKCWMSGGCKNIERLYFGLEVYVPRAASIPKNPPHKEAATVWINWLLSKEGQTAYVQAASQSDPNNAVSQRKDVTPHPSVVSSIPDLDHPDRYMLLSMGFPADDDHVLTVMKVYRQVRGR